ncbi:MAG: porin [Gammaproteobacteria bacterium]|nr:porin [Gammaproteobacteria bacterium]NNJ51121.1 porin [Gammaproteobacteria bacterium]
MKKSILAIAVAATMAAPAAIAAPTVYGNVHLSLNQADNDIPDAKNNLSVSSNTSALGVKGSEDLGDGLKAIYKLEFGVTIGPKPTTDPDSDYLTGGESAVGALTGRDQFVGLKGGFGAIKFGTMSSNYKQMGGKVDPLYRTPLEGRGFLQTQSSALHGGRGMNRGRQTHTAQYVSPKMAGIQLVANTTFSGSEDETSGIGIRWSNKAFLVYADYITGRTSTTTGDITCVSPACETEAATKVGGKFSAKAFSVAAQYESAEDRTGADYAFLAGTFNINANNAISLTYGMQDRKEASGAPDDDSTGVALLYNHKMSKMTNVYVGYGARAEDADNEDVSMITAGIRKKF